VGLPVAGEEEFEHDFFHKVSIQAVGAILPLSTRFGNVLGEEGSRTQPDRSEITPLCPPTV
jgi:hypothetical protein